jgi:hypothetical protein
MTAPSAASNFLSVETKVTKPDRERSWEIEIKRVRELKKEREISRDKGKERDKEK